MSEQKPMSYGQWILDYLDSSNAPGIEKVLPPIEYTGKFVSREDPNKFYSIGVGEGGIYIRPQDSEAKQVTWPGTYSGNPDPNEAERIREFKRISDDIRSGGYYEDKGEPLGYTGESRVKDPGMNAALSPNSDYEGTETWGNPYTADEQRWMTAAKRNQDRASAKLDQSIDSIDPEKIKAALRMGESDAPPAPQQKGSMVPSKDSIIKAFRSLSEPYKFEYIPTEKDGE